MNETCHYSSSSIHVPQLTSNLSVNPTADEVEGVKTAHTVEEALKGVSRATIVYF